ncbi:MAG: OmpA family protein [Flavobacteriales bacterium]|nr:OmpA family protein [Flavobacteriales bacterium]
MKSYPVLLPLSILFIFTSCVSERKFQDEVSKLNSCAEERAKLRPENINLTASNADLQTEMDEMRKRNTILTNDTAQIGTSHRRLVKNYDKLTETYDKLLEQTDKLKAGSVEDAKRLTAELQTARRELQEKQDALREVELALARKEGNLDKLDKDLQQMKIELEKTRVGLLERELRVMELEDLISAKDSAVTRLKNRIANALTGFVDQGLTIEQRDGKVYVSMEDRLLFASGSWTVDTKGRDALKSLAKVLEDQPDLNILIEGHTDNVPYKGSAQVKDNWDLSVMRATSIVKILTSESKLDPKQLTAAGRSEYVALEAGDSAEARKKNRRTDIIIAPKLDELFKLLEKQ